MFLALLAANGNAARAAPIPVVAAENFYGDIALQLGGESVAVTSILANPDVDPHLFEASPAVGRAVFKARIVIANGLGYDPWMQKLLAATPRAGRQTIIVGRLVGARLGDNPHIWYDPRTMLALAAALETALAADDPAHTADYSRRLASFRTSLAPVTVRIARLRERLAGTAVTATEPVFGYMFRALGMIVKNGAFQLAVMNATQPGAAQVARFEADLRRHRVALLVYNRQATDRLARRMENIAREAGVPVLGVTETEPPNTTYQAWMLGELAELARLLPAKRP
ncbi:MAG: metal ABC transporter solute-binding protein, Zn/Mn family [Acetobacteraceae bacterium]